MTKECIFDLNRLNSSGKCFTFSGTPLTPLWIMLLVCQSASVLGQGGSYRCLGLQLAFSWPIFSLFTSPCRTIGRTRQGEYLLLSDSRALGNQVTLDWRPIPWMACKVLLGLREAVASLLNISYTCSHWTSLQEHLSLRKTWLMLGLC